MRRINYIINSEMTRSEKSDSIDKTEMEDLLMNGDEKTDNEVTKNLGQLGNKKQGFQKTQKTNSTEEQKKMPKYGTSGVEKQKSSLAEDQNKSPVELKSSLAEDQFPVELKSNLAEDQSDRPKKNELGVNKFPVEQKIGMMNPIHQQKAEEELKEVKEDVRCGCKKHCESEDLSMKEPRVIFKKLTKGEEDIPHTIKWLEDIHRNVERDWCDSMKTSKPSHLIKNQKNGGGFWG